MAISKTNYTSNLTETIYNRLKTVVGTTYTKSGLDGGKTLDILFLGGYPPDITVYKDSLPLIILEHQNRTRPEQFEQGGKRRYTDLYVVHVIAGGYGDDSSNAFLKNELTDRILFGFDLKSYDITNYDTGSIEGNMYVNAEQANRTSPDEISVFEQHHTETLLTAWSTILNN
jgi:hypothetical protein